MTHDTFTHIHEPDPPIETTFPPTWPGVAAACSARRKMSPWSDQAICDRVKELWSDHSASEIRDALKVEFGIEVSRNAVVGRLHRAKLTLEQKTKIHPLTSSNYAPRVRSANKPKPERSTPMRQRIRHASPEVKAMRCEEIAPLNIDLLDLKHGECRFPYGDGPFVFCGHPALNGSPYCQPHQALTRKPTTGVSA